MIFWVVLSGHFAVTALILRVLNAILPCFLTCYSCTASILIFLTIARYSFVLTKRRYLGDYIQPENRAVLITGCDSGFGNGLARRLDSKGFHVFASCLLPEGAGASELRQSCSRRLQVVGMDVTKDDSVKEAVQYVKDNLGTSDLWAVVNNAGIYRGLTVELSDMEHFTSCMEVNAFGVVRVTKAFLPLLRQSKGRVVNVTSLGGRLGVPYVGPYCMSKFAAVAFNDCLRQELAVWGVRVISVEPEGFKTQMANPETVLQNLENTFAAAPADVKADYGERFFQDFRSWIGQNADGACPKVHKVVDSLEQAVSLEHPDLTYRPCRNLSMRILIWAFECLPYSVQDLAVRLGMSCYQLPRPSVAK